ncbi:MAG: YbaB/EbfC family nucleoid-associated protein [Planctomycetaceae bacterium]|jgi:DNA-binding YbaB/EbfC family protein
MFKEIGKIAQAMKQAGELKGRMQEMQQKLQNVRVEGEACGGAVRVEMSGLLQVVDCQISPALAATGDADALGRYVLLAVNQALDKARQAGADLMGQATEGLDLPGLSGLMGGK